MNLKNMNKMKSEEKTENCQIATMNFYSQIISHRLVVDLFLLQVLVLLFVLWRRTNVSR